MPENILVLEDDEDMRELLAECLCDAGYQVASAESGEAALAVAQRQAVDLIVADVRMRQRDGIETVRLLRRSNPSLRTIIITGYASDDAPSRAVQVEAEDYLYKPFTMNDLMTSVQRVLAREEDRGRYAQLLGTVRAGYQRLKDKATTVLVEKEFRALERLRDRAFASFYIGVRSDLLKPGGARALWQRVMELETERERLKGLPLPLTELRELAAGYQYVTDLLAAVGRANSVVLQPGQDPERALSEARFTRLYTSIREGTLSSEQLKLAPFLLSLDPAVRRQSQELEQLYQLAWG